MKLQKQYLLLHRCFSGRKDSSVNLEEVAEALECTHRNAALLMSRMNEKNWIRWVPSRGRGRLSRLQFLIEPDEMARQIVMKAASQRDMLSAVEQLRSHAGTAVVQESLEQWLFARFGYHSETKNRKRIETLRLPIRQSLHSLDPLRMNMLAESFVASHIFDTLVKHTGRSSELSPLLAHDWETDAARTTWTFYLRKGVFFHNGKEFDSEDALFTLERLLSSDRRTLYRSVFKQIKRVHSLERYAVRIELAEPSELFLPFLATSRAAIVPKSLGYLGDAGFDRAPVGTGPFKVASLDDRLCVLEVFPSYFRERAHLDRVEIWQLPSQGHEHREDDPDLFRVIHNPRFREQDDEVWRQIRSDASVQKFITMNTRKSGPLTDPVNRSTVVACLQGTINPSDWSDGAVLTLATIPPYERDARQIISRLADGGIPTRLLLLPPEQFKGEARLSADLILFTIIRDHDEQLRLYDLFRSMAEHMETHTVTDIDTTLRKITKETDPRQRTDLFKSIEQRLKREHILHIVSERPIQTAFHKSVRGVAFNPQGWVDLRRIWFRG